MLRRQLNSSWSRKSGHTLDDIKPNTNPILSPAAIEGHSLGYVVNDLLLKWVVSIRLFSCSWLDWCPDKYQHVWDFMSGCLRWKIYNSLLSQDFTHIPRFITWVSVRSHVCGIVTWQSLRQTAVVWSCDLDGSPSVSRLLQKTKKGWKCPSVCGFPCFNNWLRLDLVCCQPNQGRNKEIFLAERNSCIFFCSLCLFQFAETYQ